VAAQAADVSATADNSLSVEIKGKSEPIAVVRVR